MPNPKLATPEQSFATRRRRALKKQARRQVKRREKIMAGLTDRLTATMLDFTDAARINADDTHVPLVLLPARQLRRRVAELNRETESFHLGPPSPETSSCPDPACMTGPVAKEGEEPPEAVDGGRHAVARTPSVTPVRHPRRRGRRPVARGAWASSPLQPFMPDQERTLRTILDLCNGGGPATPGVGRRHPCPCCHRRPEAARAQSADAPALDPRPLAVYPTAAGDLVFRCHRCGFCLDSVEFLHHAGQGMFPTLADAARWLGDGRTPAAAQLAGYERLGILRPLFERGRAHYRQTLPRGQGPRLFGDWALLGVHQLADLFPDRRFPKTLPTECLGRLGRDGFGRMSVLDLYTVRCFTRLYRLELRDWEEAPAAGEAMVLFTGRWADYLPWRRLIVCERHPLAFALKRALARWPDAERLPLAMLEDGEIARGSSPDAALAPETSLAEVWLALRGHTGCATAGLAFCGVEFGATVVHVRRLPPEPGCHLVGEHLVVEEDRLEEHPLLASQAAFCNTERAPECVEDVAATVVAEKEHQPLAVALADVLNQAAGMHPAVRQRLVEAVAGRGHVPVEELVAGMDLVGLHVWPGGPYALNAPGGTSYVARSGCYWRRGSREKAWTPVSNFCLHLVGDEIDARGRIIHHARLEVGGGKGVELTLSTAVLESAKRMMTALTAAATRVGMDYPVISDPKAKRLLPELVKATRFGRRIVTKAIPAT